MDNSKKSTQPSQNKTGNNTNTGSTNKKSQNQRRKKSKQPAQQTTQQNTQKQKVVVNNADSKVSIDTLNSLKKELIETQSNLSDLLVKFRHVNDNNLRNEAQIAYLTRELKKNEESANFKQSKYDESVKLYNEYIDKLENQSLKQHITSWLANVIFLKQLLFVIIPLLYIIGTYAGLYFFKVAEENNLINVFPDDLTWVIGSIIFFAASVTAFMALIIPAKKRFKNE